jgi:hypothetical protein
MSTNFRELSNFHFKVYTESLDDSNFYEAAYKSLKKTKKSLYDGCQLSFYSSSDNGNGNGNISAVMKSVERDSNNIKHSKDN